SADRALTVLVANDTASAITAPLALANASPGPAAQVWRWQAPPGTIVRAADQPVSAGGFAATYPARSLTLFVVPQTTLAVSPRSGTPGAAFTVRGAAFHAGAHVT